MSIKDLGIKKHITPTMKRIKKERKEARKDRSDPFIFRIPLNWYLPARRSPHKDMAGVAMALWYLAGKTKGKRGPVVLTKPIREEFVVNQRTAQRCIRWLEEVGLARVHIRNSNVKEITLVVPRKKRKS